MAGRRSAYAARDVVNALALKSAIEQRSRARGDSDEVRQWLLNHFYRHVVGNFSAPPPALQPVESVQQAHELFLPLPVPPWLHTRLRLGGGSAPVWIDSASAALLALEQRLVEFLGSRRGTALDGKLQRVNAPQALALWAAEHAAFESAAAAGWREHQPDAIELRWQGRDGQFVELRGASAQLRTEMAYESQLMRHCLGQFADRQALTGGYGEHYAQACESGALRLFSYRSANQQPHVTIAVSVGGDGCLSVEQIKGKQNRAPIARYRDEVRGFLDSLDTTAQTPPDAVALGLVRAKAGWLPPVEVSDDDDQVALVQHYPALVKELPRPSALVQWLVAARQPEQLNDLPLYASVATALRGSQGE